MKRSGMPDYVTPYRCLSTCRSCGGRGVLLTVWVATYGKDTPPGEDLCRDCHHMYLSAVNHALAREIARNPG